MAWLEAVPLIDKLELGFTMAADIDPAYREEYFEIPGIYSYSGTTDGGDFDLTEEIDSVAIWGVDLIQPILSNPLISLAAFTALAVEPVEGGASSGVMFGAAGRIISFIPYMAQLRFLGETSYPLILTLPTIFIELRNMRLWLV